MLSAPGAGEQLLAFLERQEVVKVLGTQLMNAEETLSALE